MTAPDVMAAGLDLVPIRRLVDVPVAGRIPLRPGDRALVTIGEAFASGAGLAEIVRDGVTGEVSAAEVGRVGEAEPRPGDHWASDAAGARDGRRGTDALGGRRVRRGRSPKEDVPTSGEVLYELDGRWRVTGGALTDRIEAPVPGQVDDVRSGIGISFHSEARALPGAFALGTPVRGRLEIAAPPGGELRAGAIDVSRRGTILVAGARVDAEALTRARAMGVRGVVVASLAGKERRDLLASAERQLAGRHRLESFAVLVLDGSLRRPIASAQTAVFKALVGREVGILIDPPTLVFDHPDVITPIPPDDHVRIRSGPRAGEEGRWLGLVGVRRFAAGVHLEAARVLLSGGESVVVPLADLERFR